MRIYATPRRDEWQLEADILHAIYRGTNTTMKLTSKTNLRWTRFRDLIQKMERSGFLVQEDIDGTKTFKITERGRTWAFLLEQVKEMAPA